MPLITLPRLPKKKQQQQPQRRPTISHPFPSTVSPHALPSPHPSTPSLGGSGSRYTASTPSTLNNSLPVDTAPTNPPLRPSSPLALPARTHASDKQRRSGGGVRYRDWLILPGRNGSPQDGREELAGHADGDAGPPVMVGEAEGMVEFETATVFTALAREDPKVCARWARMAAGEGKGFGVDGGVVAEGKREVDLEVVDAFLEVGLEDVNGRVLRARLAKRRRGLLPGQLDKVGYGGVECFGGEEGVLRRDRRQGDIIRGMYADRT